MKKTSVSEKVVAILAIILVAGIFYIGYERGQRKELKKTLDVLGEKTIENIAIKDEKLKEKERELVEVSKKLEDVNGDLDRLEESRGKWKEEAIKWKEKASEAPPEALITDIRAILGTDEVWLVDDGVCFSIGAFRKVSEKLYDWQDFSLKREPEYQQTIETYKVKVYLLEQTSLIKDAQIVGLTGIRTDLTKWNKEQRVFIEKSLGTGFWATVKTVGTGIVIGAMGVLILR